MKTYNILDVHTQLTEDGIAGLLELDSDGGLHITNYRILSKKTVVNLLRLNFGGIWANESIVEYSKRQLLRNHTFS